MRWLGGTVVAVMGAVVLTAPGSYAANQTVTATPSAEFLPKEVTINQGDTVTWTNAGGDHNVVFDDGSFTQPPAADASLWSVSRTFSTPGAHPYYCVVHGFRGGIGMSGTVIVNQVIARTLPEVAPGSPQAVTPQGNPVACISKRRFQIRIREPRGTKIKTATVLVNGKSVAVTKRRINGKLRHTADVDLRGLARGSYEVEINAVTDKGKRLRGTRTYRTCADKLASSALPAL
jgi:plastocyanin